MAVFDASFANKKTRKPAGGNYSILVDQLDILEASLSSDGHLAPGDYALLNSKAREIYAHPGLSPDQRSNLDVKMARYASQGKQTALKDQNDVTELSREVEDTQRTNALLLGSNPEKYLEAQGAMYREVISQLSDAVNNLDAAGDDPSAHINELNAALSSYGEIKDMQENLKTRQPGTAPTSGYAAYITTNAKGEITDIQLGREGTKNGYLETNGVYGGMKIYGKLNRKENGANIFVLGNDTFRANDFVSVDPATGGVKSAPLLSDKTTGGRPYGATKSTTFVDTDISTLRTQSAVRAGSYVEGDKGFIYRKEQDGSYTKFVNSDREKLKISDNDIIKVPRSYEQSAIFPAVKQTIDGSVEQAPMPSPIISAPYQGSGVDFSKLSMTPTSTPSPRGRPATGTPTESAPQQAQGIAGRAIGAAKGFLGRVFGGQ